MHLRRNRKKVGNQSYDYWTLCESVRTAKGPRQRVVASLGKLTSDAPKAEAGWEDLTELLEGSPRRGEQGQLGKGFSTPTPGPSWELADLKNLRVEHVRDFGEVWLGLSLWRRLGLHKLLSEIIEPGREEVPWAEVAGVLTVARSCAQRSELGIAEHWYERTALADLTGIPLDQINDDRLYRGLDVLGAHKDKLCAHLQARYRDWFGVRFEFLLYDVTSTYFEGQAQRIWVMDRGMVSEKNLEFLRSRQARYLVGTPKSQLKGLAQTLLEKEGWHQVQSGVEARLVPHPDGQGDEQFVLCRSDARAEKERAMLRRQSERLCEALMGVSASLQRRPQSDREKLGRRIGRLLGKYPAAAALMDVVVEYDSTGAAVHLNLSCRLEPGQWKEHVHGAYLLRTNCTEKDPVQLWKWYIQLNQAEAAFRTAKSDLGLRPICHQKTERVEAHILVCFLALRLWRVLEQWMNAKGLGTCARKLVAEISTIKSMDVVVPVKRAESASELRIRTVGRPERPVAELIVRLGLELPLRNRIVSSFDPLATPKKPAPPQRM